MSGSQQQTQQQQHLRKPSSRTSTSSRSSNTSLGIGSNSGGQSAAALSHTSAHDAQFIKLRPENSSTPQGSTYDCLVYVIICPEHDKVAVTSVDHDVFWFPFVTREGRNWNKAIAEGLLGLFERKDPDGTVIRSLNFEYKQQPIELFRLQGVYQSWSTRMTTVVNIGNCRNSCESGNNLSWMSISDLLSTCDTVFWGPEYRHFIELIRAQSLHMQVVEQTIEPILQHFCTANSADLLDSLFTSCNVTADMLCDLYEDFLAHSYPSYYMNLASFCIYMKKCGFTAESAIGGSVDSKSAPTIDETQFLRDIFRAALRRPKRANGKNYLEFLDVAYALVAMDPAAPNEKPRGNLMFAYYDRDGDGTLNADESERLIRESGCAASKNNRDAITANGWTVADLNEVLKQDRLPRAKQLLRLPSSVFARLQAKKIPTKNSIRAAATAEGAENRTKSSRERYICPSCRVKKFEYGHHCVMIDSMGRCVEPKIILCSDNPNIDTGLDEKGRYSMECAFNSNSMGNVFFDYIRNRKFVLERDSDRRNFFASFKQLCEHIGILVGQQPKLVKCQSPAVVIGDLNGNLDSLFAMEQQLWRAMPVIGDELIFLGNYTGTTAVPMMSGGGGGGGGGGGEGGGGDSAGRGIEVVAYLFALKYLCPNKVTLLRGIQETRGYNEKTLLVECRARFGDDLGRRLWEAVNAIFDRLPYVALINESIVCTSSGIPKDAVKQKLALLFENVSRECDALMQVMTNMPDRSSEKAAAAKRRSKNEGGGGAVLFRPIALMPNAFTFTFDAFRKFMSLNSFSYMIRSNEAITDGFEVCFRRRCITIFSNDGSGDDGTQSFTEKNESTVAATTAANSPNRKKNQSQTAVVVAIVTHPLGRIHLTQIDCSKSS